MLKSYLLVTFRNLWKNKVFTLINIIGLGIALSVCIVAFFNICLIMSLTGLMRISMRFIVLHVSGICRDGSRSMALSRQPLGWRQKRISRELKGQQGCYVPVRLLRKDLMFFRSAISYVDPEFLDIFTFPLVLGEKKSIENQGNVLISSKMAATLFGSEYPIGKAVSVVDSKTRNILTLSELYSADLPENSSFSIDILTHFDNFLLMWELKIADWKFWMTCFFCSDFGQINASVSKSSLLNSICPVQNKAREDFKVNRYSSCSSR